MIAMNAHDLQDAIDQLAQWEAQAHAGIEDMSDLGSKDYNLRVLLHSYFKHARQHAERALEVRQLLD